MNWYKIFYWVSIADGVKDFFDAASNIFTTFAIIFGVALLITTIGYLATKSEKTFSEEDEIGWRFWIKTFRRLAIFATIISLIFWGGYIFTPTKKDALVIIAGGAIGNFITSDSSAKQVPAEAMTLLRDKIRSEIVELRTPSVKTLSDSLQSMSKEELIKMIKKQ